MSTYTAARRSSRTSRSPTRASRVVFSPVSSVERVFAKLVSAIRWADAIAVSAPIRAVRVVVHTVTITPVKPVVASQAAKKVIGKRINSIFTKLDLPADNADDHRRVRAVLTYLRG
jgi:hypothetical protein